MGLIGPYQLQIIAAARCGSGRSFAPPRIRSAQHQLELRPRYLTTTSSPIRPSPYFDSAPAHATWHNSSQARTFSRQRTKRSLLNASQCFSTMHRAPAAMVTKPMADPKMEIRTPRDPNTLSNYHNFVTKHTSVDFDIDFSKKRLFGSVVLTLESLTDEDVKEVILDSRYELVSQLHSYPYHIRFQNFVVIREDFFGWIY